MPMQDDGGQNQVNLKQHVTLWTKKEGALNVATSLDLFGHISVLSKVEKAIATVAIRKPACKQEQ